MRTTWTTDEFTGRRFGKYEVLCRLAVGGMAEIFLGFAHAGMAAARPVVLKRILTEQREDPVALQMLIDEAKLTATLSHRNVAQIVDLEVDEEDVVLVIEFIAGANLEEVIDQFSARKEALPLGFALAVIRDAALGLKHAHERMAPNGEPQPIVHRDVTPRNIMVDFQGGIKVLDFGIARTKGTTRRTQVGMVRGTTAYMSPEQAVGKDLDVRSDLFSLGIIAHELLTGRRLFQRSVATEEMAAVYEGAISPPSLQNRYVPKSLDEIVLHMLERKRDRRCQSASEVIVTLNNTAGNLIWTTEQCAELVRKGFAQRRADIDRLLAKIPTAVKPEEISIAVNPFSSDAQLKTIIDRPQSEALAPAGGRLGPTATHERVSLGSEQASVRTDGAMPPPALANVADATAALFDRTIIDPSVGGIDEIHTDPIRSIRSVRSVRTTDAKISVKALVLGIAVSLVLGALGGAVAYRTLFAATKSEMGQVSILADRQADLYFDDRRLGQLPLQVRLPMGRHVLEVREVDQSRGFFDIDVTSTAPSTINLTLDSLRKVP